MNVVNRQRLIDTLRVLQQRTCAYGVSYGPDMKPESGYYCDCKFCRSDQVPTYKGFGSSEQSGCPEISNAIVLLEAMTDEQYIFILQSKGHNLLW